MSAMQRKQCPRCGRFLPDSARVHWPCVLARLSQTWFVRLPAALLGTAALLGLLAALLVNVPGLLLLDAPAPAPTVSSGEEAAVLPASPPAPSAQAGETTAEVIVAEAELHDAPGSSARVVRTATSGERFTITAQADAGGLWYQVWTDAGPLWVAAFSMAVAQGEMPVPLLTVAAPTEAVPAASTAAPQTLLSPALAPTLTSVPTVPAQAACVAAARTIAVLYSGPGTAFTVVDALGTGQSVTLDGQASDSGGGVWWRVQGSGLWVSSGDMDGDCEGLPFAAVTGQPPPTTPADCPDAQPRRLRVGGQARALTDGLALARTAGGSEIIARLAAGQELAVIGGPTCAPLGLASVTWWEMQAAPGVTGWAFEEAGGVYSFAPAE